MSKRLALMNLVLVGLAATFAVFLVRDLAHRRPLPAPPAPRRAPVAQAPAEEPPGSPVAGDKLSAYNVIVAKHLFNPSRSEAGAAATAAPAAPPAPKPTLMGVVMDGPKSRAYLEDATTKRVFGFQVGDTVAGGKIEKITDDKVIIVRPDGPMEVLLRDPAKPKPAPTAPAPGTPGVPPAGAAVRPQNPPTPGQPPVPPRTLRRLPVEQQQHQQ